MTFTSAARDRVLLAPGIAACLPFYQANAYRNQAESGLDIDCRTLPLLPTPV